MRCWTMSDPITIDIPHKLGKAAARMKLEQGIGQIAGMIPGGSLKHHQWEGDTLSFAVEAMGQGVASKLTVFDDHVHAVVDLPPMIALFAGKVKEKLGSVGTKLLR
jgi:hypothetical protein